MRFGVFAVDMKSGELTRQGMRLHLHDKPFQVLAALLERPGDVVTRRELHSRLWPDDVYVDFDNNLNAAVRKLRRTLGDSATSPRFVETLPRRGYRFIAQVEAIRGAPARGGIAPAAAEPAPDHCPPVTSRPLYRRWQALIAFAAAALAAAVLAGIVLAAVALRDRQLVTAPERLMLAVLPFDNFDRNPDLDFFTDGLTEELITQLGRLQPERLGVISRISAMTYKATEKSVKEIGRELGVDYVLEGSVRASGERGRITAQLIQVSDQTHVWAETYDAGWEDVLDVQGDVAIQVATELALELLPNEPLARARAGTRVTKAYEQYLRGRYEWNRFNDDGYRLAIGHFEQAVELDLRYAVAWAGLANTYNLLSFSHSVLPAEVFPLARKAARAALAHDERSPEGHNALAFVLLYADFDLLGADREFERALELSPNYAMAYHWRAGALAALEHHDQAIEAMERAVELDPRSLSVSSDLCWYYLFADRWDEAIAECRHTLELSDYGWARSGLYVGYVQSGRLEEALVLVREDLESNPDPMRLAAANLSDSKRAFEELLRVDLREKRQQASERDPLALVFAHAAVGELDEAFEWLEKAWAIRDQWLVFLKVDPRFDPLRADPRFAAMARRVGLP